MFPIQIQFLLPNPTAQAERSLINRSTDEEISAATKALEEHIPEQGEAVARESGHAGGRRRTVGLWHIGLAKVAAVAYQL